MISKRGLIVAGAIGTGSVLLAAGSAFACSVQDFKIDSSVACDVTSGSPLATFSVTDNDSSHTAAVIDVFTRNADGSNGTKVASLSFSDETRGAVQTASVPWVNAGSWNVVAETNRYIKTPQTSEVHPSAASNASCAVQKPPTQSATPTTAPAAPIAATSAPATPAPAKSSSGAVLAETGGGSSSGMIGGFAAALVVVGGGVLFTVRRRAAAGRHN